MAAVGQRPMLSHLAACVGVGLAAGLAGTAAMTVSSTVEARLRGRAASTTPARAASAVLGVSPVDDAGERRFNQLTHWGTGQDGGRSGASSAGWVWTGCRRR